MLNKSNSRVKWRNKFRKPIKSKYGVVQGGVLSPKLFTEFLSEYLDSSLGVKLRGMQTWGRIHTNVIEYEYIVKS